jgi:cytoskeletal protein RodZ
MVKNEFEKSRFSQRTKKRKTNFILNSLIAIVLLLIIIVSANIFFGDDDASSKEEQNQVENEKKEDNSSKEVGSKEDEKTQDSSTTDSESKQDKTEAGDNDSSNNEDNGEVVTEGGTDSNVTKTIVNPGWEPVGTVQTGEHSNVYDGVDWDEMVKAISYATGLPEENMTIKFLGNNGPNKSVGTVFSKDKTQIYRVYIEWVDNQGWKPTKVEELASIQ